MLEFIKMHGCGNDFIVLDFRKQSRSLSQTQILNLCQRRFGVGCDLLTIMEFSDKADFKALFFNADGTISGTCGNASRCVAALYMNERGVDICTIETGGGILKAFKADKDRICVDMGEPLLEWEQIPLAKPCDTYMVPLGEKITNPAVCVNMGNPHAVIFVDDVKNFPVERVGPLVEHMPLFPERTNVEFVQVLEDGTLRQRTWERGCGETLACGSGACAVAVAAIRRELIDGRHATIILNGGTLEIEWRESDNHVLMIGPAKIVYKGVLAEGFGV